MAAIDEFLNSYLRSLPEEQKQAALNMIGEMVEAGFTGTSAQKIVDMFLEGNNTEYAASFLAYLIRYEQSNPEFIEHLRSLLKDLGLDNIDTIVNAVDAILDGDYFDYLADTAGRLSGKLPEWFRNILRDLIKKKTGLELSDEELQKLLSIIRDADEDLDHVVIKDGSDRSAASAHGSFEVYTSALKGAEDEFESVEQELDELADQVLQAADQLDPIYLALVPALRTKALGIRKERMCCKRLKKAAQEIAKKYSQTEKTVMGAL